MTRRLSSSTSRAPSRRAQIAVDERGEEHRGDPDDARHAIDGELAEGFAGLGGKHQGEVLIAAQLEGGMHDTAHEEVFEVDRAVEVGAQPGEEVFQLADSQRLEQHVLAAREHAVQRGPRDPGLVGDVFDRDLGQAPPLAARLGGIEHALFRPGQDSFVRQ